MLDVYLNLERLRRVKELEGKPAEVIYLLCMDGRARVINLERGYFIQYEAGKSDDFIGGVFVDKRTGKARFHEAKTWMMSWLKEIGTAAEVADKMLDWLET
jgi:hypothetical protein